MRMATVLGCFLLLNVSCSEMNHSAVSTVETIDEVDGVPAGFDVNRYALNKLVCDPMGGGGGGTMESGISAELFYLQAGQDNNTVQTYFDIGTQVNNPIFFNELYVPTRKFDLGFPKETGGELEDNNGDRLIEYFALKMKTKIHLAPEQEEGYYELALLSDDGSRLRYRDVEGQLVTLVDNDGDHPTRFGCGNTFYFDHDTALEVEIDYYQGPRYHISLIPMWKKVASSTPEGDVQCGRLGNNMYFDFANNSTPQTAYLDLLTRGWMPLNADNYSLPSDSGVNPCTEGTVPVISDFDARSFEAVGIFVTWTTDIPATSQVLYRDVATGEEVLTESDNMLRTDHSIFVPNLPYGNTYEVQAVSISADYGKGMSDVETVTVNN